MHLEHVTAHTLIGTKLNIPRVEDDVISRPSLLTRLDNGLGKRLSLIAAPTGYGKTTLAVSWLSQQSLPVAWFSVGRAENDPMLFCHYLVSALHHAKPGVMSSTLTLLDAPGTPSLHQIEASLINDLTSMDNGPSSFGRTALILAIDDYHLIHDPAVNTLMSNLILHMADQVHILLITRQDPLLLPINQLRARNGLVEIRQRDLRFSLAETQSSLSRMLQTTVSDELAVALDQRLEGWPTGLRLTSLAVANDEDATALLARSGRAENYITDFLVDEVLARQSPARQRFLLETAILDRLCDDLCRSLLGSTSDHALAQQEPLSDLAHSELFVIALDHRNEWFRYHHFFQEMLVRRLHAARSKEEVGVMHQRAAQWYARQGFIEEAIDHSLRADDSETAAKLIEEHSRNPLNGIDRSTHERWLAKLPTATHHPRLLVAQLWLFYRQWRFSAVAQALNRITELVELREGASLALAPIQGHLSMMRAATLLFLRNDTDGATVEASNAVAALPQDAADAKAVALNLLALGSQLLGEGDDAIQQLHSALHDAAENSPSKQQLLLGLAMFHRTAADLHGMAGAVSLMKHNGAGEKATGMRWIDGMVQYEWNKLEAAKESFTCVSEQRQNTNFAAAFNSILGLARIAMARGRLAEAAEHVEDAQTEAYAINSVDMMPLAMAIDAELSLHRGDVKSALQWARSFDPNAIAEPVVWLEAPSIVWGRVLASAGQEANRKKALMFFEQQLASLEFRYFTSRSVQMQINAALLSQSLGRDEAGLNWLAMAVKLAETGASIRPFADGGSLLIPMLRQLQNGGTAEYYVNQILSAFDHDISLQHSSRASTSHCDLTPREFEILKLIQSGKTNQEIADNLVISEHTVKRHATNIYRKLDVRNRTQAIRVAQASGILSQTDTRITHSVKQQ